MSRIFIIMLQPLTKPIESTKIHYLVLLSLGNVISYILLLDLDGQSLHQVIGGSSTQSWNFLYFFFKELKFLFAGGLELFASFSMFYTRVNSCMGRLRFTS